jgi:hypothetical protein
MKNKTHYTLRDLLINKIHVLYDMEHELAKAVPRIIKATTNKELKKEFTEHFGEIKMHIKRLEQIHQFLEVRPKKLTSAAIRGLIEDTTWPQLKMPTWPEPPNIWNTMKWPATPARSTGPRPAAKKKWPSY